MNADAHLLRQYVEAGSEAAFGELVARHIDLVHSAAVRVAGGDTHLAQDVTQTVFGDLARKARRLPHDVILAGWLYQAARYAAANAVRAERRRVTREQEAASMQELTRESNSDWSQVRPLLDEAMGRLGSKDRDALLLHFFERKEVCDVASDLGLSQAAVRKRLSRAVEKLRRQFSRRGLTFSSTALAAVLTGTAVEATPPGLTAIVTASSLAGLGTTSSTAFALAKTLVMTKLKSSLLGAAIVTVTVTALVQHQSLRQLWEENNGLREQAAQSVAMAKRSPSPDQNLGDEALDRMRQQQAEVMRLRGEVTRLRPEAAKVASLESEVARLRRANTEEVPPGASKLIISNPYLKREAWSDKGTDSPYHALETMLWAGINGQTQRLAEVTIPGTNPLLLADRPPLMKRIGVQIVTVDSAPGGGTRIGAIVEDQFYGGGLDAPPGTVQGIRFWYLVQTNGEWKVTDQSGVPGWTERASNN